MSEYNGWTNYETWCVNLWIENEPGTYDYSRNLARDALEAARDEADDSPSSLTVKERAVRILADRLLEWVEGDLVPNLGDTLAADLLGAALSEVNWDEIASHYVEEEE